MRLRRLVDGTIVLNLVVILLGAVVRATGSGAGCGQSWPTCRGRLVPAMEGATAVEFTHRAVSGLALVMVAVLIVAVFRATTPHARARRAATWVGVSIVIEAAIGMVIVLAEWVAEDASLARAVSVPIHLVSTFVLLAALVATRRFVTGDAPVAWRGMAPVVVIAVGLLGVAATGAVTALADTLFPKEFDLATATTAGEHFLTRLRILHPIVAVAVGVAAAFVAARHATGPTRRPAALVVACVGLQIALGVGNVVWETPLPLSLVHLLLADALWMGWVWLSLELAISRAGNSPAALDVSLHP